MLGLYCEAHRGQTTPANIFLGPSDNFCFPGGAEASPRECVSRPSNAINHTLNVELPWSHQTRFLGIRQGLIRNLAERKPYPPYLDSGILANITRTHLDLNLALLKSVVLAAGALFSDDAEAKALGDSAAPAVESTIIEFCRRTPSAASVQVSVS
ncbi:hypothetical protein BJX99DRAFT_254048 [Aspergillus californicus]